MNDQFQQQLQQHIRGADAKMTGSSALLSKNVRIHARRTSVRLEPEMWNALKEIAALENCSIHDLCGAVHDMKEPATSFTAALRVFLMEYYRTASKTSQNVSLVQRRIKEGPVENGALQTAAAR